MKARISFLLLSVLLSISSISQTLTLEDSLVAYYPFNENADDLSGHGHHGVINGGVSLTTDRFGNSNSAYYFNGNDGYIQTANSASMNYPTGYSLSIWVKFNQVQTGNIVTKHNFGINGGFAFAIANQNFVFILLG